MKRDSVSLLSFSLLSHIQIISWVISLVSRLTYIPRIPEVLHLCRPWKWRIIFWHLEFAYVISRLSNQLVVGPFVWVPVSSNYYNYYLTPLRVFHTSVSWWFLTGVWETASLLKSPGLVSVFRPILVLMVFTCHLISKSSGPFTNLFCDCSKFF